MKTNNYNNFDTKQPLEVYDLYLKHPATPRLEVCTFEAVKEYGENEEIHVLFFAGVIDVIQDIVLKDDLILARKMVNPRNHFTVNYLVDCLAGLVYLMRKDDLGLKTLELDTSDFSFDLATEKCDFAIDRALINKIMAQITQQTVEMLPYLELDNNEIVNVTGFTLYQPFEFHKIIGEVFYYAHKAKLYDVEGMCIWPYYNAVYEIAHKIYNKYMGDKKDKVVA